VEHPRVVEFKSRAQNNKELKAETDYV